MRDKLFKPILAVRVHLVLSLLGHLCHLFGSVMISAEPAIHWEFWVAVVALEIPVMQLMKEPTDENECLVPGKDCLIARVTGRGTQQLPMQDEHDMDRVRWQHQENQ